MLRDVAEHAPQAGAGGMHSPRSRSTARPEFGHPPQLRRALSPPHLIVLPRCEPSAGDPSGRAGGKWWWCIPRARVSLSTPPSPVPAPARAMPGELGNCPPQIFRVGTFPTGVFQPGSKTHLAFPAGEASGGEIPGPLLGPGVLVGGFTNAFSPRNPSIFYFY